MLSDRPNRSRNSTTWRYEPCTFRMTASAKRRTQVSRTRGNVSTSGAAGGHAPYWHGELTVGLKGPWGQVRVGRALDVIYGNDWTYDPWDNNNRIASPAWYFWHYNYPSDRTGSHPD